MNLPPLDTQEIDDVPFIYTEGIRPGETIVQPVSVQAVLVSGTDPDPDNLISGAAKVGTLAGNVFTVDPAGTVVLQRLDATDRPAGNLYGLRALALLSSGRRVPLGAFIGVAAVPIPGNCC